MRFLRMKNVCVVAVVCLAMVVGLSGCGEVREPVTEQWKGGGAWRMQGFTPGQAADMQDAMMRAARMISAAQASLASSVGRAGVVDVFGSAQPEAHAAATEVLTAMNNHLQADDVLFYFHPEQGGAIQNAFVDMAELPRNVVHIRPRFFEVLNMREQAETLVHELSHLWGDTYDFSYKNRPEFNDIVTAKRLLNADHYVVFCSMFDR